MEYRRLGSTGLKISSVALGCGNFGGVGSAPAFFGQGEDRRQAFRLLDESWDLGINLFDSADAYGGGRSERFIGEWLKTKPNSVRQQILVSSKVFNRVGPGVNDQGLSRRHILRQIDSSLSRLGVERLDLYLVHEPDPETELLETLSALDDLVHAGKVHYVGASNFEAWRLAKSLWISDKHGLVRFEWVQNSYSLLDRAAEGELLPLCLDQGLGFTPFSPMAGGWLSGKYRQGQTFPAGSRMTFRPEPYAEWVSESTFQSLARLGREADRRGVEMGALALAWAMSHPQACSIVAGPRRPSHFSAVRQAIKLQLSPSEREEIASFMTFPPS